MTTKNVENNAPKENNDNTQSSSSASNDTVKDLYSSLSDLTNKEKGQSTPDWLPKADSLLSDGKANDGSNGSTNDAQTKQMLDQLSSKMEEQVDTDEDPDVCTPDNPHGEGKGENGDRKDGNGNSLAEILKTDGNSLAEILKSSGADLSHLLKDGGKDLADLFKDNKDIEDILKGKGDGSDLQKVLDDMKEDFERHVQAKEAVDILTRRGDMGNEFQRKQIQKMYRDAYEKGGEKAVQKLTETINEQLKAKGSSLRVQSDSTPGFLRAGQHMFDNVDHEIKLKVTDNGKQVDEAKIEFRREQPWDRNPWGRRGGDMRELMPTPELTKPIEDVRIAPKPIVVEQPYDPSKVRTPVNVPDYTIINR